VISKNTILDCRVHRREENEPSARDEGIKMRLKLFLFIQLSVIVCFAMTDTTDYSLGSAALNRGDLRTAKARLTLAYKQNPTNPAIQLAFASIAPCSTAVPIYKCVSELKTAPDSLRGNAYKKLGQYYYASSEYSSAIECYRNALKYGKKPEYRHNWALAALASGDEESAQSIWHTLTLEYGDTLSEIAQYHLGLLSLKQKKYQEALNYFSKTGTLASNRPWAVASIPGKIECAKKLGLNEKVTQFEKQLDPYRDLMLENDLTNTTSSLNIKKSTETTSPAKTITSDTLSEIPDSLKLFTLQIGAFSSKENAQALEKKVKNQFSDVSIVQLTIDDKTFYRVRIGTFKSKPDAENFGADSVSKKGLLFRIVEK
jgi:tetratricopeptide (TPR) repeat protein